MRSSPLNRNADHILEVLDKCCDACTFPMLDNGYLYLAGSRMSLHRSDTDWAIVIEVFGFSPRAGLPDTHIYTFASRLHARKSRGNFVNQEAYERYLSNNPHNESRFVFPIEEGGWQDPENSELIAPGQHELIVRGRQQLMPTAESYSRAEVTLSEPPRITVFEFCRALSFIARDDVLATSSERGGNVLPEMRQILQLEEWHHPDIVDDSNRPSNSETFRQLAQVLVTGDVLRYKPTALPNTHWKHWPVGGSL